MNNITTNLEKINLARVERIGDDDVHILAQRFYELETMNELQIWENIGKLFVREAHLHREVFTHFNI